MFESTADTASTLRAEFLRAEAMIAFTGTGAPRVLDAYMAPRAPSNPQFHAAKA